MRKIALVLAYLACRCYGRRAQHSIEDRPPKAVEIASASHAIGRLSVQGAANPLKSLASFLTALNPTAAAFHIAGLGARPAIGAFAAPRVRPPPRMMEAQDAAFYACTASFVVTTALFIVDLFMQPPMAGSKVRSSSGGGLDLSKIKWDEVEDEVEDNSAGIAEAPAPAPAPVQATTEVRLESKENLKQERQELQAQLEQLRAKKARKEREELQAKLDEAVQREDYMTAASLKKELDELS